MKGFHLRGKKIASTIDVCPDKGIFVLLLGANTCIIYSTYQNNQFS